MGLLDLIVMIAVVGLLIWAVTTLIPMPEKFKQAIYVLSVVFVCLYVLNGFGLLSGIKDIKIGK